MTCHCLIRERKLLDTAPLYLRDGDPIPEGVDPDNRIIVVTRSYVEPPKREEDQLPTASRRANGEARAAGIPEFGTGLMAVGLQFGLQVALTK